MKFNNGPLKLQWPVDYQTDKTISVPSLNLTEKGAVECNWPVDLFLSG